MKNLIKFLVSKITKQVEVKFFGKYFVQIQFYILFLLCYNFSTAQPVINYVALPGQTTYPNAANAPIVGQYQKFELDIKVTNSLTGENYLNPVFANEIEVGAVIKSLSTGKTYTVGAFFYQNYNKTQPDITTINPLLYSLNSNYVNTLDFYTYCSNNPTPFSVSGGHPYEKLMKGSNLPIWKLRFSPMDIGYYSFKVYAKDQNGMVITSTTMYFISKLSTSKGFVKLANKRYLKYDNGETYFPIGSGMQWYNTVCYLDGNAWKFHSPETYGTVEYETHIERLALNRVNFIRIFLTQEGLGVFGYDYSMDVCFYKNVLFRDPTTNFSSNLERSYGINLRDAWQLDYIVNLCEQKNIKIQLALMNSDQLTAGDMNWANSPYNVNGNFAPFGPGAPFANAPFTKLTNGCVSPYDFFSNTEAINYTKNCYRYLLNRYSYSTSIMGWEIFNEIANVNFQGDPNGAALTTWVTQMRDYIKSIDIYKHPVTASTGYPVYASDDVNRQNAVIEIGKSMDYTDDHQYFWNGFIDNTTSANKQVYNQAKMYEQFEKPHFVTESGAYDPAEMPASDPNGFSFHSLTWSSCFSGSLGSIINNYTGNMIMLANYDGNFAGVSSFFSDLKLDEDNNMAYKADVYSLNEAGTNKYYMVKNNREIYGWAQDNNYTVEHLNYLKSQNSSNNYLFNLTSKPASSMGSGPSTLSFPNVDNGVYTVQLFETQNNNLISEFDVNTQGSNSVVFTLPASFFSDPSNKYGDVAYKIKKNCHTNECSWNEKPHNLKAMPLKLNSSISISSDNSHIFYVDQQNTLFNSYFTNNGWHDVYLNFNYKVKNGSKIITDSQGRVFYIGIDGKVKCATFVTGTGWQEATISGSLTTTNNGLFFDSSENIYFSSNNKIYVCTKTGSVFLAPIILNATGSPYYVSPNVEIAYSKLYNEIYYAENSLSNKLGVLKFSGSTWSSMNPGTVTIKPDSKITIDNNAQRVFYIGTDNLVYNSFILSSSWYTGALNPVAQCIGNCVEYADDHVFYVDPSNNLYNMTYDVNFGWLSGPLNLCRVTTASSSTDLLFRNDRLYYIDNSGKLRYCFWENITCPPQRLSSSSEGDAQEETNGYQENNLTIYPNPSSSYFHIEYQSLFLTTCNLEISNLYGEVVYSKTINTNYRYDISTDEFAAGMYIITVRDKENILSSKKIVISK